MRESFVRALCNEIRFRKEYFNEFETCSLSSDNANCNNTGSSVTTLYIGGGTPSVLTPQQLQSILECLKEIFGLSALQEFTIEVNPNDITPEYASFLADMGVNRVSMGVQSFIDEHLVWMNRRHNALEGERAFALLREAGIKNISLDLIFGYQMLDNKQWEYNISKMIELAPEHISAYQMSVEPGSALNVMLRKGEYSIPSQEACEHQYRVLQKMLSGAGYEQYEISNFSKPGYHSRHNSSYWSGVPYLGLGPGAHSYNGSERFWNNESVKKYCAWYGNPSFKNLGPTVGTECLMERKTDGIASVIGMEQLTEEDKFNEAIMLGLRRTCGFSSNSLNLRFLQQIEPQIEYFVKRGLLIRENGYGSCACDNNTRNEGYVIRIPQDKLFISDSIIRELFV